MSEGFDTDSVVDDIFNLLEDVGLLREADPFLMRSLRHRAYDHIEHELWNVPNSFEVGAGTRAITKAKMKAIVTA